jgi:hypothetical protein
MTTFAACALCGPWVSEHMHHPVVRRQRNERVVLPREHDDFGHAHSGNGGHPDHGGGGAGGGGGEGEGG